ncbi:hypothetical protein JH308_07655 [Xanthomonas campestris pv. campestris]|uniref:hypothetical protein n=1 Tax=Xanthomonas campestris TaxID=339 RepID=UPI001E3C9904|nr:hypothetical protein [Xanthomonas campestris]MCC5074128.1 hypothetical protein [Xanthomonas campestris pv. plantaginis]WDK51149.1 hypothetical protein JH308_07655 [Xanthomonas campestris pv. campestris]WDK52605.1 hypothetical protein JH267_13495 [Xanthomonas campestris pv. campestris]WDL61430.1 hypothetical protein JH259_13430 [Xanthomonas campestris pv. campestris]
MTTCHAQQVCEDHLREQITNNEEAGICASETKAAQRLLSRSAELKPIYKEIEKSLGLRGLEWKVFLDCCVLATGAYWTPSKNLEDRSSRRRLEQVNTKIAALSFRLADLLDERDSISNTSPFSSNTLYHPIDVMERADQNNFLYRSHLKPELENLTSRFDLKYWPSLADMVRAIGRDAENAEVATNDARTAAMSESKHPSKADFVRALHEGVADNQHSGMGGLPRSFRLSDSAAATLANVLLELPADEMVDAKYAKNIRGRDQRKKD